MIANDETLFIGGFNPERKPHSLGDYVERTERVLNALRAVDPIFSSYSVKTSRGLISVGSDLAGLKGALFPLLDERIDRASANLPWQDRLPARLGYSTDYYFEETYSDGDLFAGNDRNITVSGAGVGAVAGSGVSIRMPANIGSMTLQKAMAVIEILVRTWGCNCVEVQPRKYSERVSQHDDRYSGNWLLLLPQPDLNQCLPSDINTVSFLGGTLITVSDDMPNYDDPSDIALGKAVREALDNLGLTWNASFAVEGWPPDEQEWLYEEAISGAPRGRKYRVHCVDFDGYDYQRDVLLFVKLFRQLRKHPKQWGLRGWDGPVINEARRQVRAAQGKQVEWHIGLEEPAHWARELIADHTNITEQQLRIIYTPVEAALGQS